MILLSHPGGHRNVPHVARALRGAGVLGEMWTFRESAGEGELCQIEFDPPLTSPNGTANRPAVLRTLDACTLPPPDPLSAASIGGTASADRVKSGRTFDLAISRRLKEDLFTGIYAYQDAAEHSFRAASRRGLQQFYDLSFGHRRAALSIFDEEAALEPEWAATLARSHSDEEISREDSELQQASLVFVTSMFGLRTLDHAPSLPGVIAVIPYGAPRIPDNLVPPIAERQGGANLRVLYAGELNQRHGLSYLFQACRELQGMVTLTVMGAPPRTPCPALERELRRVQWRPPGCARQLIAEMATHDVFVFPSLFDAADDGFLLAMAMGLPVIATPNTSAPDLIQDGVEGFIVPLRSSRGIAEKLEILQREPARRANMAASARRRAARHSWENYERALAASVVTALSVNGP